MNKTAQPRKKILIIANPVAGKMHVKHDLEDIQPILAKAGFKGEIFFTKKSGDATTIVKKHYMGNDIIVCAGGDGTLNEVITGMVENDINIPIGYLPSGTTNDMASSLNIPTDMHEAAAFLSDNHAKNYDIGSFNNDTYFNYIASFGAFAKTAYATPQWFKNRLGYNAYILSSITMLDSLHPYELTAKIDDKEICGKFIFGGISNSTSVAGIIDLSKKTKFDDGKFEVLLIKYPESLPEAGNLLDAMLHKTVDDQNIFLYHGSAIEFKFKESTAWTLDGEFGGEHKDVNIKILEKAVKIIY